MDTGRARPEYRPALRKLSNGLIAYGIVAVVAAALGLGALIWADSRVSGVSDSVEVEVAQMTLTLDRTADTLHDAGTLAGSFAVTLERTPASVRQAAQTVRGLRPNLQAVGSQLGSFELFGSAPLAGPARLFEDMATSLQDLDMELELLASDLDTDRSALTANAASLTEAGDQAAVLADRIRAGFIQDSFDDIRTALAILVLTLIVLAAIPASAALGFGVWLRRSFRANEPAAAVSTLPRSTDGPSLQPLDGDRL